jgi:hypothetical protein
MTQEIYTIPILAHTGFAARADGRPAVSLDTDSFVNASILVPKTGTVTIGITLSSKQPRQGINVFVGIVNGRSNLRQEWGPLSGDKSIGINEAHILEREKLVANVPVTAGDLLGIRIVNKEPGFRLGIASIHMRYTG